MRTREQRLVLPPLGLLLVTERFDISAIEATAVEDVMRGVSATLDATQVQFEGWRRLLHPEERSATEYVATRHVLYDQLKGAEPVSDSERLHTQLQTQDSLLCG